MENATEEMSELHGLLMTQSLTDEELLRATGLAPDYRILPDVSVLKIGGQSVIDRGRGAVYPVVEQLAGERHQGLDVGVVPLGDVSVDRLLVTDRSGS